MQGRKSYLVKTGTIVGLGLAGAAIVALVLYGKQIATGARQVGQEAGVITASPIVGFGEGIASTFKTGLDELKTYFGIQSGSTPPGSTTSSSTPGTGAGSNPPPVVTTTANDQLAAELAALRKKIDDMNNPNKNPSANPSPPPPTPPPAPTATPTTPPAPNAPSSGYVPGTPFGGAPGTFGTPIPGVDLGAGSTLQAGNNAYQYLLNLQKQTQVISHPNLTKPTSPHSTINTQSPTPDIFSQIQKALQSGIQTILPGIGVVRPIAPGEIIPGLFA